MAFIMRGRALEKSTPPPPLAFIPSSKETFNIFIKHQQHFHHFSIKPTTMRIIRVATGIAALVSSVCAYALQQNEYPPPRDFPANQVSITGVKYTGSGCPPIPGASLATVSNNRQVLQFMFSAYTASIGGNTPPVEQYKNCLVNIRLRYPQGWTYTVYRTDYIGYASLDKKVTGQQKSIYYYSSNPMRQWTAQTNFTGPINMDYRHRDFMKRESLIYCGCSGKDSLNINTSIRLQTSDPTKKATGLLTVDMSSFKVMHQMGLQWKRCT